MAASHSFLALRMVHILAGSSNGWSLPLSKLGPELLPGCR